MKKEKLKDFWVESAPKKQKNFNLPECDILVNNHKRKIYGKKKNKVYLNNDDNVQFRIFNPTYNRIGVQLEFNGVLEEGMLVINPGEKIILDRFIDSKKKIKFSTYMADMSDKRTEEVIRDNGSVKVIFWNEKINYPNFDLSGIDFSKDYWFPSGTGIVNWDNISNTLTTSNSNSRLYTDGISGLDGTDGNKGTDGTNINYTNFVNSNLENSTLISGTLYDAGVLYNDSNPKITKKFNIDLKETGRVEKGKESKQEMIGVEFDADTIFHTIKYKLLPYSELKKNSTPIVSRKPKKVYNTTSVSNYYRNTDYRIYCDNSNCGYRIRNKNWSFCPMCGNKL